MKVVIWISCFIASSTILVLCTLLGVPLGGIPTALVYVLFLSLAKILCQKWDDHKDAATIAQKYDDFRFPSGYKCGVCGRQGPYDGKCPDCGSAIKIRDIAVESNEPEKCYFCSKVSDALIDVEVHDDFGVRYKKICPACLKKKNNNRTKETAQIVIPKARFCRKCGKALIANSEFCGVCGTRIQNEDIQQ